MRRIHYAWIVAGLTFFVLLASAAVRSAPSLFMVPLEAEFGWPRTVVSSAVAINILLFGLVGPFAASWMQRWGLRRACFAAASLVAAGVLLSAMMTARWQLILLWGVVVGIGTGGMSMVLAAVVANRWFDERRGLVTGALSAANATGQLLFLPLMARVVAGSGWRTAAFWIGGFAATVAVAIWIVMRDSPESMGIKPYGWKRDPPKAAVMRPLEALGMAVRRREFWLLAGTFFVCGASTNGLIGTHLIPACHDHGITEIRAAGLLAMMGIFDIAGTTASGWLTDRFSPRILLFTYYLLRGFSLLLLPAMLAKGDTPELRWFAVLYGLDWIATVPPTVRLCADAFGRENTGVIYGWIGASHQLGASLAALLAGSVRTVTGDYQWAFQGAALLCMIAAAAFLWPAGSRRQRDLAQPGEIAHPVRY
jgi:predicted MFS family arabinose efflux permease